MKSETGRRAGDGQLAHVLAMLHELSDGIDEEIYVTDPETYGILFVNKKMEKRFGKNVTGKRCYRVFHDEKRPCPYCNIEQTFGKNIGKAYLREMQNPRNHRWYRCMGKAIRWPGDRYVRYGLAIDITKHKRLEEALRTSEQRFRSIVENSHEGIAIIDDNFKIIYVNSELSHILGYRKEEVVGQDFRKFLAKESKGTVQNKYLRRLRGEKVASRYEFKIVQKSRLKKDVEVKSSYIRNRRGEVQILAQLLDITERKRMENERRRFEDRLSALNEYGRSLNMARSMDEIYRLTLDASKETLGFKIADIFVIEGKVLRAVAHTGYSRQIWLELPLNGKKGITVRAAKRGRSVYVPDVRKDKSYSSVFMLDSENGESHRLVETSREGIFSELAVPIKAGNEILGVLNVESQKLAAFNREDRKLLEILASHAATAISNLRRQEQLKEVSKKLAYLMKSASQIMNVRDTHRQLRFIASAIRKFGWRRVVISLRDEGLEGTDIVTAGLTKQETELLLKRKAPGRVWKERFGPKFERFKMGQFYYLPWADSWIRRYVHGVSLKTPTDEATTYAGVPSRLSPKETIDWHPQDMLYAPLRTPSGRIVGILSMDDPIDGRMPTRESLGPLELFLNKAAIMIENAQLIESLREAREQLEQKVEERTRELRKSQEQLLKAQRLAVIGELAGMVGHDLRNPLTSIAAATYYVKTHVSAKIDGKVKEIIELIEKNIAYSNKIINDLLDYSREIELELTDCTPRSLIKECLLLCEIPSNIRVIDLTENRPKTKADVDKLKRAFVNMIRNALDAMPKGGELTIKSEAVNKHVKISFADTGEGMSKETLKKLWTPLFTTKAKGMGFGLPICKRIVEAHGGRISVESSVGKGTTISAVIPVRLKKHEGGEEIWVKTPESSLLMTTRT